jgi:hypothetical protein
MSEYCSQHLYNKVFEFVLCICNPLLEQLAAQHAPVVLQRCAGFSSAPLSAAEPGRHSLAHHLHVGILTDACHLPAGDFHAESMPEAIICLIFMFINVGITAYIIVRLRSLILDSVPSSDKWS